MRTTARRGMARTTVTAWRHERFTGALTGDTRVVSPVLEAIGCPWQWKRPEGHYLVPLGRLDDVLAALELAGHWVDVELGAW